VASTKQTVEYRFSRRLNGLAEKQRWWPAYITSQGNYGISVDPVLFHTNFGPNTQEEEGQGLIDESNQAGVRVECLNIDGTPPSGTPTIQIVDSGTHNARCILTHPDGTSTEWRFVAPSHDLQTSNGYGNQYRIGAGSMNPDGGAIGAYGPEPTDNPPMTSAGPYPVYATLQDFIDWLDGISNSWNKLAYDSYWANPNGFGLDGGQLNKEQIAKSAWLPHGLEGDGTIAASSAWPQAQSDPRISASHNDALPNTGLYIATMFMPLLYDNNQLALSSDNADNDIVKGRWMTSRTIEDGTGNSNAYCNFYDEGMTRYTQTPAYLASGLPNIETADGGEWKWFKNSGDFKNGRVASIQEVNFDFCRSTVWDYINWDIDPSSSAYGGPSYRMRTALACFLKDGTYNLSGGSLIPYTYDPKRTVGGHDGNTCYAVWNGRGGVAITQAEADAPTSPLNNQSAQIFPLFDFLQGPLCPPAQGWNYDMDGHTTYQNWLNMTSYISKAHNAYTNGRTSDGGTAPDGDLSLLHISRATQLLQPRSGLVRPNPTRERIYAIQQHGAGTATTITTAGTCAGLIEIWVEDNNTGTVGIYTKTNRWRVGMPVHWCVNGLLGGNQDAKGNDKIVMSKGPNSVVKGNDWSIGSSEMNMALGIAVYEGQGYINRSGWWVINKVESLTGVNKSTIVSGATGTFTGHKLSFVINQGYVWTNFNTSDSNAIQDIAAYAPTKGYISQGILGGSQYAWGGITNYAPSGGTSNSALYSGASSPYSPPTGYYAGSGTAMGIDRANSQQGVVGASGYPIEAPTLPYLWGGKVGLGFYGGLAQGSQNVPQFGGLLFTHPTRITHDPMAFWWNDFGGWYGDDANTPLGIAILSQDYDFVSDNPLQGGRGGGMLRLNAPSTFGWASHYFSTNNISRVSQSGIALVGDWGATSSTPMASTQQTPMDSVSSRNAARFSNNWLGSGWFSKSISILMQSFIDQQTGKHAWEAMGVGGGGVWKWPLGRNRPYPVHERQGTKAGYGIQVGSFSLANEDKTHSANMATSGAETTKMGLTELGCSPVWLDLQIRAWFPVRDSVLTAIEFDNGASDQFLGRHALNNFGGMGTGFAQEKQPFTQRVGTGAESTNREPRWSTWNSLSQDEKAARGTTITPAIWLGAPNWSKMHYGTAFDSASTPAGAWENIPTENAWPYGALGTNNVAWGSMGNSIGTGASFAMNEGYHTLRTVFDEEGMTVLLDGDNKGKDLNSNDPIWGFSILFQKANGSAYWADLTPIRDNQGFRMFASNPAFSKTNAATQLDEITVRHIPTTAMIPFPVDTIKQQIAGVGKYTALSIEVDNIKESLGMNVKVSICPATNNVGSDGVVMRQEEGGTPYENFEKLSINAVGGFGSIDLTELPADAITNGFVIRFHFYTPTASDTNLMPVDWSKTPIVRSWTLEYDLKPVSSISCIGNTYNGDITAPIDTKVGHIVSFRNNATTTDIDRTLSAVKFDFGDGTITDWLPFTDLTLQSNFYDTAHSYLTSGTYTAKAYVRDDNGNESLASNLTINVANAAPVAVLRAVPSLVRAGQPITLDGTDSFDINAGATLASYTFTYGDGSGSTSNASGTAQHTYATAGEYQATLVVVDNDGASSQTAIAIIKVLPATLVIPLVFNTKPRAFQRTRTADFGQTPVLDAVYPEMTDTGQRHDEFTLSGSFLTSTANSDIEFCEELLISGSLVEFMWEDVDYDGVASGRSFVGRITAFDYNREGGKHGETPYSMTLVREAGLGA
jgi:hypothetical protein